MKYNDWTLGQVEAVFNKLGGDDGVRRFLAGELVVKPVGQVEAVFNKLGGDDGVRRFLAGELVVKPVDRNWPTWKTIKLGTGIEDADGFRQAIEDAEMRISDWANDIIGKPGFTVATGEMEVDLVKVTVGELGFKDGARRDQIYDRAKELGLELCPPEVGPQLRLQYKDQPMNEWILIGMPPIRYSGGGLGVFHVGHDGGGLWLGSYCGNPDYVWDADSQWVFVRPRKCQ